MVPWLLVERRREGAQVISYRGEAIGATAVEVVVGQVHRNERGEPKIPNTLLLPGIWTSG